MFRLAVKIAVRRHAMFSSRLRYSRQPPLFKLSDVIQGSPCE